MTESTFIIHDDDDFILMVQKLFFLGNITSQRTKRSNFLCHDKTYFDGDK